MLEFGGGDVCGVAPFWVGGKKALHDLAIFAVIAVTGGLVVGFCYAGGKVALNQF